MDEHGKEVIPCKYDGGAEPFSGGFARVWDRDSSKFIDKSGRTAFVCNNEYSYGCFEDGICEINDWDEDGDKRGFVNEKGDVVIPLSYIDEEEENFSEGLIIHDYYAGDTPCEYVNKKGNVVIVARDLNFYNGSRFQERLAVASHTKYGRYGFFDQRGKEIIPFVYTNALCLERGVAAVSDDGKWGFIDREANLLIPFQYHYSSDMPHPFFDENGIALVWKFLPENEEGFEEKVVCGAIDFLGGKSFRSNTSEWHGWMERSLPSMLPVS